MLIEPVPGSMYRSFLINDPQDDHPHSMIKRPIAIPQSLNGFGNPFLRSEAIPLFSASRLSETHCAFDGVVG